MESSTSVKNSFTPSQAISLTALLAWSHKTVRTDNNRLFQKTRVKDNVFLFSSLHLRWDTISLHPYHHTLSISVRMYKVVVGFQTSSPYLHVLWGLEFSCLKKPPAPTKSHHDLSSVLSLVFLLQFIPPMSFFCSSWSDQGVIAPYKQTRLNPRCRRQSSSGQAASSPPALPDVGHKSFIFYHNELCKSFISDELWRVTLMSFLFWRNKCLHTPTHTQLCLACLLMFFHLRATGQFCVPHLWCQPPQRKCGLGASSWSHPGSHQPLGFFMAI